MPNLCGPKESCWESGIEEWGHIGSLICKFSDGSGNVFVCPKTKKEIEPQNEYINQRQYEMIKNR